MFKLTRWCLILICLPGMLCACDLQSKATALGTIERDRVVLKANANEIIVDLPVKEGTFVQAGTLLVKLDERRQQARVAMAEAEKARAAARWEELRNGARIEDIDAAKARVDGAQAELTVAEKNYLRAQELRAKNLNTQASLDRATASRDSAQAALESATKQLLALTNGTRKEELDQAEAQFHAAEAQLELEQIQLAELRVTATRDGYLDSLPWNVGERVAIGTNVAVLLANNAPYARVYVPEPYRATLTVGDRRKINIDGVDKPLQGSLRWIATEPAFTPYFALNEQDRAHLMYLAEFDLEDAEDLPIGMPAEVILGER